MSQDKEFHIDDKVRSGYQTGTVTGFNGTDYRIFWYNGGNMYHEFVPAEALELLECKHG